MNKQEWISACKSFARAQRRQNPAPSHQALTSEEQWQCHIVGRELISWYQDHLPQICREREELSIMQFDPQPFLVVTTDTPGLVAAQAVLPEPAEDLVYLLHDEYLEWLTRHPVDRFNFHIHHWSYFDAIERTLIPRARLAYLQVSPEEYRIHTSGDLWGIGCGEEEKHLWRWDGEEMRLLEEAFAQSRLKDAQRQEDARSAATGRAPRDAF